MLTPPVMGTVRIASLLGLVTASVAVKHWAATVPAAQFCSGAKATVMTQDCSEFRLKGPPCEGTPPRPQVSVSVKLLAPSLVNVNMTPASVVPEVFVTVTVCVVGGDPTV